MFLPENFWILAQGTVRLPVKPVVQEFWMVKAGSAEILVRFGCMLQVAQYKSPSMGHVKSGGVRIWVERLSIPDKEYRLVPLVCPICRGGFLVKVRSSRRTLYRKYFVSAFFLAIGLAAMVFSLLTPKGNRLFGFGLASPFLILSMWHIVNALRGKLSPNDILTHAGGKVHRILDEG